MRVYLVGYMGSGKTTLAKEMAKKLGFRHIDLDEMIEKETRKTIDRVFTERGEERFRFLEARLLRETKRLYNIVVATGGGTASYGDNMDWMNQNGITVYLKVSEGALYHRLVTSKNERPLLRDLDDVNLMEKIQAQLVERETFYAKAKHVLKSDNIKTGKILTALNLEPVKTEKS